MVNLKTLTKKDLLAIANQLGLEKGINSKATKDQIIKYLQEKVPQAELEARLSPSKKTQTTKHTSVTEDRIFELEKRVASLEAIIKKILAQTDLSQPNTAHVHQGLSSEELLNSLNSVIQKDASGNRWVTLDSFYDNLRIYGANREAYDKMLLDLYYQERIELAEGSHSQYRIKIRGSEFGRISLRKK